jgi:ketosteroid isomerase-like protein
MSQENLNIVRGGYELYTAGDLAGVAALFATDAELADGGGLGVAGTAAGTRRGPEGFLKAAAEPLEAFDDYQVEAEDFIAVGEAVLVPVRITGRGKASGVQLEVRLVHLWVLRDGKVLLGEVYETEADARAALGRAE